MITFRKEMSLLPPYEFGEAFAGEMKRLGITRVVRLNSNEGPLPPFPAALEAMQEALVECNRYPDPWSSGLRKALAEKTGAPAEGIVVGGGAVTLIRLLCMTLLSEGEEIVIGWPMFPPYLSSVALLNGTVLRVPLRAGVHDLPAMLDAVTEKTKMVVICNPNNPTATVVSKAELDDYFSRVPDHVLTVLDEAYIEFVEQGHTAPGTEYFSAGKPLAVLRSFSKAYGMAGMRVGYAFTSPEIADVMRKAQEGFPVNHVAQVGALVSLASDDVLRERVRLNAEGRRTLESGFDALGLKHTRSAANFVFVDVERDSDDMFRRLMTHGVLIRPGRLYDSPSFLRVTIGDAEENEIFLDALRKSL